MFEITTWHLQPCECIPSSHLLISRSVEYGQRVDEVLYWMGLPAGERPDFMTLYINQPDSAGHDYGPYHANVTICIICTF